MAAGFTEDEVRGAWNFARSTGYTEATGLGADRLTAAGRTRVAHCQSRGDRGSESTAEEDRQRLAMSLRLVGRLAINFDDRQHALHEEIGYRPRVVPNIDLSHLAFT
jgi:hypothetical protein